MAIEFTPGGASDDAIDLGTLVAWDDVNGGCTILAHVFPRSYTLNARRVLSKAVDNASDQNFDLDSRTITAVPHVRFRIKVGGTLESEDSTTVVAVNTFYTWGGTYINDSKMIVWLDGLDDNSKVVTGDMANDADNTRIGAPGFDPTDSDRVFDGFMDDVGVWNLPLHENAVLSHHHMEGHDGLVFGALYRGTLHLSNPSPSVT